MTRSEGSLFCTVWASAILRRSSLAWYWQWAGSLTKVIPFAFKVRNGFPFLTNIRCLRSTGPRRLLLDAIAYSGLGWAGAKVGHSLLTGNGQYGSVHAEPVSEFSIWADEI